MHARVNAIQVLSTTTSTGMLTAIIWLLSVLCHSLYYFFHVHIFVLLQCKTCKMCIMHVHSVSKEIVIHISLCFPLRINFVLGTFCRCGIRPSKTCKCELNRIVAAYVLLSTVCVDQDRVNFVNTTGIRGHSSSPLFKTTK